MTSHPDFIIIGAMKCATSTLHEQLANQSGIFMTTPKEPNFFSNDDIWMNGIAWYQDLFGGSGDQDLCGESSTHYTKLPTYPHTISRMEQVVGEKTRFIYIIRHPIDRLISHYIHEWSERTIDEPINIAIQKYPRLVEYGEYAKQLTPYLERFGHDRILLVFSEGLSRRPQEELERVCKFLGYHGEPRWNRGSDNQNSSGQRMRLSPTMERLKNLPGSRALRRVLVPERLREQVKGRWRMQDKPTLNDACKSYLTERFDSDLSQLGQWYGLLLSCENFKTVAETARPTWTDGSVNLRATPVQ